MGKKDDSKVSIFLFSLLPLKSHSQLSSSSEEKFMTMLKPRIQKPKLQSLPKSSVRCGVKLTKLPRTALMPNMSIIKPNMIKINKLMKDSMVKLKERRRKSLKKKNEVLL